LRLRVNPDSSWLVIRVPGSERHREIPQDQVAAVPTEFQGIGEDAEKFAAFVNADHSIATESVSLCVPMKN